MLLFERLFPGQELSKEEARKSVDKLKTIGEFFANLTISIKDTGILKALESISPFTEAVGESLKEAAPPIKFLCTFIGEISKVEPEVQGYLACTLAYHQSFEQALNAIPDLQEKFVSCTGHKPLEDMDMFTSPKELNFDKFTYQSFSSHSFIREADDHLSSFCKFAGLDQTDFLKFQHEIHLRFVQNLKGILSHGKTKSKFGSFSELIEKGSAHCALGALAEHADYQRWLFEENPVFGQEQFALGHIYTNLDCGKVLWKDFINAKERNESSDPFNEKCGGRQDLLTTVIEMIKEPRFKGAVVIQGAAGSGKSSFTLKLCTELINLGLRPIRIELRDLKITQNAPIFEMLAEAVRLTEEKRSGADSKTMYGEKLFQDVKIFDEYVTIGNCRLCPYILILDGWDEISLGASDNFQEQVKIVLKEIYDIFLNSRNRSFPIRVILTGRPSDSIKQSGFIPLESLLLTIRPFTPDQLESYVNNLKLTLEKPPLDQIVPGIAWDLNKMEGLPEIFKKYKDIYHKEDETESSFEEMFNMPLLSYLSLWLLARWAGNAMELVNDPTMLYKSIVDMVVSKGGKYEKADYSTLNKAHLTGTTLRILLRNTAQAITACHTENISQRELKIRLQLTDKQLDEQIKKYKIDHVLSRLMISFFFKGGRTELGCEFTHKSFREYLFAEQIVEKLKEFGRENDNSLPERNKKEYWKEFDKSDPRWKFSRTLAELFSSQWITPEIDRHMFCLIDWEINRSKDNGITHLGEPTDPISFEKWKIVRDTLADIWDWWGEGIHLRPQPYFREGTCELDFNEPLAIEICKKNRLRARSEDDPLPPIQRTTTADAYIGDGIFRIVTYVHSGIAGIEGYEPGKSELNYEHPRRYQIGFVNGNLSGVLFTPSGPNVDYFKYYTARINSAGFRWPAVFRSFENDSFPIGISLFRCVLNRTNLKRADLIGVSLIEVNLTGANLEEANLVGACLVRVNLIGADLVGANLKGAYLLDVNLAGANLTGANLKETDLINANLTETNISLANLSGAKIEGVDFTNAKFNKTNITGASIENTNFTVDQMSMVIDEELSESINFECGSSN